MAMKVVNIFIAYQTEKFSVFVHYWLRVSIIIFYLGWDYGKLSKTLWTRYIYTFFYLSQPLESKRFIKATLHVSYIFFMN